MEPTRQRGSEASLRDEGLDRLKALLGPNWEITPRTVGTGEPANLSTPRIRAADVVTISDPTKSHTGPILVEVTEELAPRMITEQLVPRVELMRALTGDAAVLIISPWLSPRSRQVLEELGYGYLDLTGNVSFRINRPGIVVRMQGAQRAPTPRKSYPRQLKGDKAGALVRAMVDVRPPHRASELALATGVSLAYVSRLLDVMEGEALITRRGRSIISVDWRGLLRARSATYDLLRANPPASMVAPKGVADTLERLACDLDTVQAMGKVAVTGPIASAAVAPLTVGGQLMIHVEDSSPSGLLHVQRTLGLLPTTTSVGGDVLLLRSASPSIFIGRRMVHGAPHVALSQLALDCLGGTGRMPAEGEAVVDYMIRNEAQWQLPTLEAWSDPRR